MAAERRRILYSGAVQGVGFRWTAMRVLANLQITGYIRNLPDGRVELVIEGEPKDNDAAAERVRAAMAGYIHRESQETLAATGEFPDFGVRR